MSAHQTALHDSPSSVASQVTQAARTWKTLRCARREDEQEFVRLFLSSAAEVELRDYSVVKVLAMFDRAIRRDRAALIVAGKPGQLCGMVLLAYSYVWFGEGAQMTMLSAFVDPDHRHSPAAKELTAFSRQPVHQQEADAALMLT